MAADSIDGGHKVTKRNGQANMEAKDRCGPENMERFVAAIYSSRNAAEAAQKLGISRQAVSSRLRRWREAGVRGLPTFKIKIDVSEVEATLKKYKPKEKK